MLIYFFKKLFFLGLIFMGEGGGGSVNGYWLIIRST